MKTKNRMLAGLSAFLVGGMAAMAPLPALSMEYGDIVMDRTAASMKKAGVKPVQFPHWFHRIRYKCKVCHEDIFVMKTGANEVNMRQIMEGKACGTCHNGKIAWEPLYCERCHAADEQASGKTHVSQRGQEGKIP